MGLGVGTIPGTSTGGTGMDWAKWLPLIMAGGATGASLIGSRSASGQMNRANDLNQLNSQRMYDMAQQERQRRDMLTKMVMPNLMQGMGVNGQQAQKFIGQMPSGDMSSFTGGSDGIGAQPTTTNYKPDASSIGQGMGMAGSIAGGLIGGPLGAMAGGLAGSWEGNLVGRGRRTANPFVQQVENPFGQQLASISKRAPTDPSGALRDLQAAYSNYTSQVKNWQAQGGKQKLVADQSLANKDLQGTYQRLLAQLGGQ